MFFRSTFFKFDGVCVLWKKFECRLCTRLRLGRQQRAVLLGTQQLWSDWRRVCECRETARFVFTDPPVQTASVPLLQPWSRLVFRLEVLMLETGIHALSLWTVASHVGATTQTASLEIGIPTNFIINFAGLIVQLARLEHLISLSSSKGLIWVSQV